MSRLQQAANEAVAWAHKNNMKLNASKTKELLIHFGKQKPNVPPITVEGEDIERVQVAKLIGVYLNDTLTWSHHIDSILKKSQHSPLLLTGTQEGWNPNSSDLVTKSPDFEGQMT